MALHQTITVLNALDSAYVNGKQVKQLFAEYPAVKVEIQKVEGERAARNSSKSRFRAAKASLAAALPQRSALSADWVVSGRARAGLAWSLMQTVR